MGMDSRQGVTQTTTCCSTGCVSSDGNGLSIKSQPDTQMSICTCLDASEVMEVGWRQSGTQMSVKHLSGCVWGDGNGNRYPDNCLRFSECFWGDGGGLEIEQHPDEHLELILVYMRWQRSTDDQWAPRQALLGMLCFVRCFLQYFSVTSVHPSSLSLAQDGVHSQLW